MSRKPATITPGQWTFDPSPAAGTALVKVQRNGFEQTLARVFAMPKRGEREANAVLMSAAPDLLQACRAALDYLMSPSIIDEQDATDKANLLVTLNTAIACATRNVKED